MYAKRETDMGTPLANQPNGRRGATCSNPNMDAQDCEHASATVRRALLPAKIQSVVRRLTAGLATVLCLLSFGTAVHAQDNDGPVLTGAAVNEAGTQFELTFDETLDSAFARRPAASAFTVTADGVPIRFGAILITGFSNERVVLRNLSPVILQDQAVVATYTDPTSGDDTAAIQDDDGNDAATFTTGADGVPAVTNNSGVQDTPPTIESVSVDSWWVTLTFSEALDETQRVSAGRFRLHKAGETAVQLLDGGQIRPSGRTVTLKTKYPLSAWNSNASDVEVSYSQPGSGGIQDLRGNRVRSFTRHRGSVLDNIQNPTLLQVDIDGDEMDLTYNWGLNTSRGAPHAAAFSVRHPDGTAVAVTGVRLGGAGGVTLTLASAARYGEHGWTVSYDASSTSRPLRVGSSGNVRSFQGFVALNHTLPTHAPRFVRAVWHDDWIRLTYDQSVTAVAPPTSAYTVTANGAVLAVASTSVLNNLVVVNLSSAVPSVPSCNLRLSYDPPASGGVTGRHSEMAAPALDFVEVRRLESDGTGAPCESRPASEGPVPVEARVLQTGTAMTVTYDEEIERGGLPTILVIKVNGSPIIFAGAQRDADDPRVWGIFSLSTPIRQDDTVTISYSRDASRPDHQQIQDTDGNEAPAFTDFPVTNDSNQAGGPALVSAVVPTSGDSVVLTYHTALDTSAAARPPANAFTVEVTTRHKDISGGPTTTVSVGAVTVSGSTVSLSNLSTAIRGDTTEVTRTVRVSYNSQGLGAKALQSTGGVDASPFGDLTATNNSTLVPSSPGVGPGPIHAAGRTDGTTIVIRFDEDMDITAAAGTAAWRVTGSGVNRTFGNIFFVGTSSIGIFSISPAIRQGEPVTVSYTKPTSGRVLQDTSGNDADSFTDFPVINQSTLRGLWIEDAEGTEGTNSAITFTVTLLPAFSSQVTVGYRTVAVTATEGSDYTATSGTLTFAPGVTSQTLAVPIIDDSVEDDGETFWLTLFQATGAPVARGNAVGTIRNTEDNPAPHVTGVELVADASGDRAWTPGETIEARLRFSEAVTVSGGSPWLEVNIAGFSFPGMLGYTSGSGSETLTFSMDVPAGAEPFTGLAVVANSLVADGSIVSGAGVAAVLAHDGTEPTAPPETDETPGGTTNAFKVTLKGVPAEHDGSTPVVFEVEFNKEPEGYSYRTMRDATLVIRQGGQSLNATKARRLNKPHNDRWEVTITPVSKADLQVSIGPFSTCTETGAVCAANDEVLANDVRKTIQGPPGLSVADATAEEGPNVTVDFAVSLSRASTSTVTVDYATSDGTAQAGSDYTETSGTLTFAAGVTEQTVAVPVLDDSHDEESETFTLTLSDPTGGNAYLADATATGTIENHDPMPKAWLTRFGRTVASQAVEAIGGRMEGSRGSHVTVGGMQLNRGGQLAEPDEDATLTEQFEAMDPGADSAVQSMSARDVLLGSSFSLSAGGEGGTPAVTGWGQVTTGGFEADVDGTRLDGRVTSAFLGADVGRDRWLAGVAVSRSEGDGDYHLIEGGDSGSVESSLTTVYPYAKVGVTDKVDVWGLAGIGNGELTLTQDANGTRASEAVYETDISMRMGAVGMRGQVVSPDDSGGLGVAVKSDAFWVSTESDAVTNAHGNLAAAEGDASRVRLLVEAERSFETGAGTLTPSAEVGVRYDGGDAETGTGIELGGAVRYQGAGITIEGAVRTLVAHEESGYEEWGASGSIRVQPSASGRGLSFTLSPTWGAAASGVERLWGLRDAQGLTNAEFEAEARMDGEVGYGIGAPYGRGLVTPYAGLSVAEGGSRTLRTGTRWQLSQDATFGLEATRDEGTDQQGVSAVLFRASTRW